VIKRTWVEHGTKIIGAVSGTIAAIAGVTSLIPQAHLKYYMGAIAVLTFWRGFINSELLNKPDYTDEHSGV
jgi:hypothetical protein